MNKIIHEDLKYATENTIKKLLEESNGEITGNNLEALSELIDIHKDIANEKYWCEKEEHEMYGRYDDKHHDSYGRDGYRIHDSYGRRERDSRGRYKGHEHLDRMYDDYGRYMESRSRYGTGEDTKKSLEYMLHSMEDFAHMLKEDAQSQEEIEMIRQTAQRIAQM